MCPYRAAESQGVPVTHIESSPDSLSGCWAPYPPCKRHSCALPLLSAAVLVPLWTHTYTPYGQACLFFWCAKLEWILKVWHILGQTIGYVSHISEKLRYTWNKIGPQISLCLLGFMLYLLTQLTIMLIIINFIVAISLHKIHLLIIWLGPSSVDGVHKQNHTAIIWQMCHNCKSVFFLSYSLHFSLL